MQQVKAGRILREMRGGDAVETVAVAVGISAASVYNYETGQVPRERIRYRLAAYFGKTPWEIWDPWKNEKEETP